MRADATDIVWDSMKELTKLAKELAKAKDKQIKFDLWI